MSEHILAHKHQAHKHQTHNHAAHGWRIHCGVQVTELRTNKQHSLSLAGNVRPGDVRTRKHGISHCNVSEHTKQEMEDEEKEYEDLLVCENTKEQHLSLSSLSLFSLFLCLSLVSLFAS